MLHGFLLGVQRLTGELTDEFISAGIRILGLRAQGIRDPDIAGEAMLDPDIAAAMLDQVIAGAGLGTACPHEGPVVADEEVADNAAWGRACLA